MISMDPNVYMAYLCLTDNNSAIRRHFKSWSSRAYGLQQNLREAKKELPQIVFLMRHVKNTMQINARKAFILEAEQAWKDFSFARFMKFLEGHGYK